MSLRKTTVAAPVLSMGTRTADAALRAEVAVRGCDSEDTLFLDVRVPDDLRSGDRLSILTAGAYASRFNGFDVPCVRHG